MAQADRTRLLDELERERAETVRLKASIEVHKENDPEVLQDLGFLQYFVYFNDLENVRNGRFGVFVSVLRKK